MGERHVVLRADRGDPYGEYLPASTVVFTLDAEGEFPEGEITHKHLWSGLVDLDLHPPQAAVDLYRIAAAAFCADLRLPRKEAFDGWTREIVLHAPVADRDLWLPHVDTLTALLAFLSGDQWQIELRERDVAPPERRRRRRTKDGEAQEERDLDTVCLFSGGLDSFIGAADAMADGTNLLLVSHVPAGVARWLSPAQDDLRKGLARPYQEQRIEHLKVTLNPPPVTEKTAREGTQRVRSIYFLALGTLAAAAIGGSTPLVVPENGFISLNLPLTPGRIGSLSTRTTHPYAMSLYREFLRGLGIDVPIHLPYMLTTKGEMLARATDPSVVYPLAGKSVSCASPNPRSKAKESHCGYCVPCIIRRSAMNQVELDDADDYRLDILNPGKPLTNAEAAHLRGFKLAIRERTGGVSLAELLAAGPLRSAEGSVGDFKGVHDRGLAEVAEFLGTTA